MLCLGAGSQNTQNHTSSLARTPHPLSKEFAPPLGPDAYFIESGSRFVPRVSETGLMLAQGGGTWDNI